MDAAKTALEGIEQRMLDKYRHELAGMMLEAVTSHPTGAELGMYVRTIMKKIDTKIIDMTRTAAQLMEFKTAIGNGTPAQKK